MAMIRKGIGRRLFLQLAAVSSGLAVWGCAADRRKARGSGEAKMRYRPLGKTGLEASEITFGAHGVDNPPLMQAAFDAGINTFFTSGEYLDGREEEALGRVIATLGSGRDRVVVITGNVVRRGATRRSILNSIDASLRRLRADRVAIYAMSDVSSPEDLRHDAFFEAIGEAKQAGKVGYLGLSGHCGGMQSCLNAAIDDGRFEVFLTKYDFVSYPDQAEILHRAAQRGIGTVVFKTNAGNRQKDVPDLEAGGLSLRQAAVKWALTNADLSSVAVTITNFDRLEECIAAVGSMPTRAEEAMLARYRDAVRDQYCRFCKSCEGVCPNGVAVADVMRYAMYSKYYDMAEDGTRRYRSLARSGSAAPCTACAGPCDAACPFGRRVRTELVEAHRLLGSAGA